jgi:fatty-acyl-CoA synthase
LEETAESVPGVKVAAAVGLPPSPGAATEEIVLAIEADPAAEPSQLAWAVSAAVEEALGFAPDGVLVLAPRTIPRTPNGKVRHAVLRDAILAGDLERSVLFSAGLAVS